MRIRTSLGTRFIALVLALMMLVSSTNPGALVRVFAAGGELSETAGALVADNYSLTEAEAALLKSGLLVGDSYSYTVPSDGDALISIDTDNAKITAAKDGKWEPTTAYIVAGGVTVQTIALTDGEGTYDPSVGNAFSVKVDYVLTQEVDEATQTALLKAAALLKQAVANADAVSAEQGNLYILEQALPELAAMSETGIEASFGTINFDEPLKAVIKTLNDQLTANGGKLNLSVMAADYDAGSKTAYLVDKGAAMQTEVKALVENLGTLNITLTTLIDELDTLLDYGLVDAVTANQLKAVQNSVQTLETNLTPVAEDAWEVLTAGVVKAGLTGAQYLQLDALVAAITTVTPAPAVVNPLKVAETTLQKNMSMFDVNVVVELKVVENKADSAVLVTFGQKTVKLTLTEGATAAEILAAVEASGIVAEAKTAWGAAYVAGKYAESATALPDALTEDIAYTVTYAPVEYAVSYDYATTAPTTVPYGYQLTLPVHEDFKQAYDYTVNGVRYAQGERYTVTDNTEVKRTEGKAYTTGTLYAIVAGNYGNDGAKEILTSGALKGDVTIFYREPDPTDAGSLLEILYDVLTAKDYDSTYESLKWKPYTYGAEGTENTFSGSSAAWEEKAAKVQYKLELTNFSAAEVQAILKLAADLKAEAAEQKKTLDRLAAYYDTMGQLDKTKLGALNGVIDVTDFTPGDGTDTDAKNLELRAYFKGMVGGIIADNLGSNNQLKIYNILTLYKTEGLRYYYSHSQEVIDEIDSLSGYLTGLLADEEKVAALEIMVNAAGYPEYAEKIESLEAVMSEVKAALTAPNAAIDLASPNLGKLLDALTSEKTVETQTAGHPYVLSKILTVMDASQVMVQVILTAGSDSATVTTPALSRGDVLTPDIIAALKAAVEAKAAQLLGDKLAFYQLTINGTAIEALAGTELDENVNLYYNYNPKTYTVKIEGEADQSFTIENTEINLPKHPASGWVYKYTIDGVADITASTYTFTPAQVAALFVDGTYTITRVERNEAEQKLDSVFGDWVVRDGEGNVIGINAAVTGDKTGLMDFVMKLVNSGYTYIGLNDEALMYLNEENTLEICLQTLINAILHDNSFSNQTLIDLGNNGGGKLIKTKLDLGNSATDIIYTDLDFVMTLTSVPSQMGTVAKGLEKLKPYMNFHSQDGVMDIDLRLPEKLYEVYLTAMLATGNVDKSDVNALNSEIAYQFLWDYVEVLLATDADTQTFTNTLAKLGQSYDLTGAEKYYQMAKKALTNEGVSINPDENGIFDMMVTAKGQSAINRIIGLSGIDTSAYDVYISMLKEYKYEDAELTVAANADLLNAPSNYEALVLDLNASGITNKFDYTEDLPARAASIADKAAVMLLGDVDGDLVFKGTAILDLNGKTVNGNITAKGKLFIVDSYLDTANGGTVNGTVSGNVTIIGGKYSSDVTAFLKDGYKQEASGAVRNALYTLESDGTNVTVIVNTDVMNDESVDGYLPNAKALAVDVAVELLLNYFTAAAISADGNVIYNVNVDDVLGFITGPDKIDNAINKVLNTIDVEGISAFANVILEDLLDFAALEDAIANDKNVASYTMTIAPWKVELEHVTDGDYLSFGIVSDSDLGEDFTVSLKMEGANKAKAQKLFGALADIVKATAVVDVKQPDYNETDNLLSVVGSAKADVVVDLQAEPEYLTVLTVILANGNPANKADLVAALNAGDMNALKAAIDELTVADVIKALKAMSRTTNFQTMAANVGATLDVTKAAELENVFHLILCGAGKVLEKLEITGRDAKLGALDADGDGTYEWSATASRDPDASYRGYTFYAEASVELSLTVNLFGELPADCLVGDVNHDDKINAKDATMILRYYAGELTEEELAEFCLIGAEAFADGSINAKDATAILRYYAGEIDKLPVVE